MSKVTVEGVVTEVLPNGMYRVQIDGRLVIAYSSGKIRLNRISILIGDKVDVELDPYEGKTTNRLVRRKK